MARTIPAKLIEDTARELMARAAIDIPHDYRDGVRRARDTERNKLARFVLTEMLANWELATAERRPMCADTGLPRYYVRVGNEAAIEGGFVALERALRRATAEATATIPLRPNRVHPLTRVDHNNNVGMHAPEVTYAFEPGGDFIDLTTVHKGGLFGSDYRMLFPSDGIGGIKRFFIDTLVEFGRRGLACQPAIVGVGIDRRRSPVGRRAPGDRRRRHRRLQGHLRPARQGGGLPAGGGQPQPRSCDRQARGGADPAGQLHRHRRHGLRRQLAGRGHPHRGGVLAHGWNADRDAQLLSLVAARHRAHSSRRSGRVPHRPSVVHRLLPSRGHRVTARAIERLDDVAMDEVRLTTPVGEADLARLKLGDVVYLDGFVYTAREGVYRKVVEQGQGLPARVTR